MFHEIYYISGYFISMHFKNLSLLVPLISCVKVYKYFVLGRCAISHGRYVYALTSSKGYSCIIQSQFWYGYIILLATLKVPASSI